MRLTDSQAEERLTSLINEGLFNEAYIVTSTFHEFPDTTELLVVFRFEGGAINHLYRIHPEKIEAHIPDVPFTAGSGIKSISFFGEWRDVVNIITNQLPPHAGNMFILSLEEYSTELNNKILILHELKEYTRQTLRPV